MFLLYNMMWGAQVILL